MTYINDTTKRLWSDGISVMAYLRTRTSTTYYSNRKKYYSNFSQQNKQISIFIPERVVYGNKLSKRTNICLNTYLHEIPQK